MGDEGESAGGEAEAGSEEAVGWYFESGKKLGEGSYGKVYLAREETGREVAVKVCEADKQGVPNILEVSIMASMRHPNLNHSSKITADSQGLYIIQRLAQRDLAQHCRVEKNRTDPLQLKEWCHCLAQAVKCLHDDQLIHSDIKASNVLLYPDGKIKLSDFSLAVKCWKGLPPFSHPVATCTHRPLENFCHAPWSYPLDVWSLGCTFFEIAYKESLFPNQTPCLREEESKDGAESLALRSTGQEALFRKKEQGENSKEKKKKSASLARKMTVNAILDWGFATEGEEWTPPYQAAKYPLRYLTFARPEAWNKPEMSLFNSLLLAMLRVEPEKRITIAQVLDHPYFLGLKRKPCAYLKPAPGELTSKELSQLEKMIAPHCQHSTVRNMTRSLYARIKDLSELSPAERAGGSLWLASKLVLGSPPQSVGLPPHRVLRAERSICHHLGFALHRTDFQ